MNEWIAILGLVVSLISVLLTYLLKRYVDEKSLFTKEKRDFYIETLKVFHTILEAPNDLQWSKQLREIYYKSGIYGSDNFVKLMNEFYRWYIKANEKKINKREYKEFFGKIHLEIRKTIGIRKTKITWEDLTIPFEY